MESSFLRGPSVGAVRRLRQPYKGLQLSPNVQTSPSSLFSSKAMSELQKSLERPSFLLLLHWNQWEASGEAVSGLC